ncbi:MAG TPA: type II secretion system minor pseudopilin GspI [Sideroxyarcus sp.]|nr:type II secretion system minor pseudopilin GspI [Sideroxyarcus sp.]
MRNARGFTLLEVLVALAVLAVTMAAISRAAGSGITHVEAMRVRVLADWVAQDRLALHTARGDWLAVGTQNGEASQAGRNFLWREEVTATPNPTMRLITVSVAVPEEPQYVLRKMSAYLVQYPR